MSNLISLPGREVLNVHTTAPDGELTMTSREIAELVDVRHDNIKRTIDRFIASGAIQLPQIEEVKNHLGQMVEVYRFVGEAGKRDSIVVVAQSSPTFLGAVVDRWMALEKQASRPMSPAEMLLHQAQLAVKLERQQAEQAAKLVAIDTELAAVKDTQARQDQSAFWLNDRLNRVESSAVLPRKPANMVHITDIQNEMHAKYCLSAKTVNQVISKHIDFPRPIANVENRKAKANGATYWVYRRMDVDACFRRFVSECKPSGNRWTHHCVDHKFSMDTSEGGIQF